MLPHLILFIVQIIGAWWIVPRVESFLPDPPRLGGYDVNIFIWAVLFAVTVFVIGFVGSVVLKGVRTPGAGTLSLALLLALLIAALTLVPPVTEAVARAGLPVDRLWWPLLGAMVGYIIKR